MGKNPIPLLRTTVEPQNQEQRDLLLNALTEIADTDPLLHYYVDTITHEIIISFLGKVQLEVVCSLLVERYHVNINVKEPTVIYLERPLKQPVTRFILKCRRIRFGHPLA